MFRALKCSIAAALVGVASATDVEDLPYGLTEETRGILAQPVEGAKTCADLVVPNPLLFPPESF